MSEDGTDTDGPTSTQFIDLVMKADSLLDSNPEKAIVFYEQALEPPRSGSPRLVIHALRQKADAHIHLDQPAEAKTALGEAYTLALAAELDLEQREIEHLMVDLMVIG